MFGDHFMKERLQYGLYGLYPKYRVYVEPLTILLGMAGHALIAATLQNDRGSLSDKCKYFCNFIHIFSVVCIILLLLFLGTLHVLTPKAVFPSPFTSSSTCLLYMLLEFILLEFSTSCLHFLCHVTVSSMTHLMSRSSHMIAFLTLSVRLHPLIFHEK